MLSIIVSIISFILIFVIIKLTLSLAMKSNIKNIENTEEKEKEKTQIKMLTCIGVGMVIIMVILGFVISGPPSFNSGTKNINTCSSCGRKYYSGDTGGNYMSIAYSSMCKNCNSNYKWQKEVKDYLELNQ